jgi:hypothetical protein
MKWRDKKLKVQHLQQTQMCKRTHPTCIQPPTDKRTFEGNSENTMNCVVTEYYSNLKARMTRYIVQYGKGLNLKVETSFSHYGPDGTDPISK